MTFTSWMSSKYSFSERTSSGVAQQRSHQALVQRIERNDVLPIGRHHATDRNLVHLPDRFADDRECVMTNFPIRHQVVGTDQIPRIDLGAVVSSRDDLERLSIALLQNEIPLPKPVRLLGVSLSSLQEDEQEEEPQLGLPI